ncbi:MAG: hypothetical protein E7661_09925 [Ruminococcaceae bacterium]|nr:hypothetical protein [Oscillospiraceae bacterium]
MFKKVLIVLIAVLVVVAGIVTTVIVINNRPEVVVKNSIANTIEGLGKRQEFSALGKMAENGSLTVDGSIEDLELDFGGKIYFSNMNSVKKAQVYIEDLGVKVEDTDISADIYFGKDYLYVSEDDILGGAYGIVFDDLEKQFKTAEWAEEIPEEYREIIENILGYIDDGKLEKLFTDLGKHGERYVKTFQKLFVEYAEFEEETKTVNCGDGKVESRVITVTIDEKALKSMVKEFYKVLEDDDKLRDYVLNNAEEIIDLLGDFADELPDEVLEIEDLYDDYILNDEMWDEIADTIGKTDFEVTMKFVTPKMSAVLRQFAVTVEVEGKEFVEAKLNLGKDGIAKTNYIGFELSTPALFATDSLEVAYEITKNTKDVYEANVTIDEEEIATLKFDRKKDSYKINILDEIIVKGDFVEKGDRTTITVDYFEVDGDVYFDDEVVSVIIDTKDKIPSVLSKKEITSVFDMDMNDIEKIADNIEDTFVPKNIPVY